MVIEVEAVDGDAGVGNDVFYEIISGKLNHNNLASEIRRICHELRLSGAMWFNAFSFSILQSVRFLNLQTSS